MSNNVEKTEQTPQKIEQTEQTSAPVEQMQSAPHNVEQIQSAAADAEKTDKTSLDVDTLALVKKTAARLLDDADFVSEYVLSRDDVRRAVIDDYLKSFVRHSPSMPSGRGALAPPLEAKTLSEAKKLCELYLSSL